MWEMCTHSSRDIILEETQLIRPDGFEIPAESTAIHGISTPEAMEEGEPLKDVLTHLLRDMSPASLVVGFNISYDADILGEECR